MTGQGTERGTTGGGGDFPARWRDVLVNHARAVRLAAIDGKELPEITPEAAPEDFEVMQRELGPMAGEALRIVEAYAFGASARESGTAAREAPPEFIDRLTIILNGLAPRTDAGASDGKSSPQIIQSELWQLLYKVRESAEMAYARELDLVELDRRIMVLLQEAGPLVPADIASTVGVDKAQVSRSVKRLLELRMIERGQIRAPLELTRKGAALSTRLVRLADMRNRELTFDVKDDELAEFSSTIEVLLDRAITLYERERDISNGAEVSDQKFPVGPVEERAKPEKIVISRTRIVSPLMTLSAYFSRSGSLTFKRLTGLSNFEAWVLNEIGMEPPIDWNTLVSRLDRDHSQAGRTIKALMDRGFVEREGRPGRRHGRFSPSAEGLRLYEIIQEASRQRSAFLLAPLSQEERDRFMATFDKIHRNAIVQLERERTFEELGHAE